MTPDPQSAALWGMHELGKAAGRGLDSSALNSEKLAEIADGRRDPTNDPREPALTEARQSIETGINRIPGLTHQGSPAPGPTGVGPILWVAGKANELPEGEKRDDPTLPLDDDCDGIDNDKDPDDDNDKIPDVNDTTRTPKDH